MVFTILGFDSVNGADIVKEVESQGGSIVPASFQGVPDYAVLPIEGVPDKFTATEVVNALWIVSYLILLIVYIFFKKIICNIIA